MATYDNLVMEYLELCPAFNGFYSGTTACWPQGESNEEDYRSQLSLIPMVFVYIITQLK
uniref:Uncharacterized protein n=1 Tax=Arundo donax TaxID=35708 RepID=A0A0A9EIS0_ARUDO